MELTGGNAGVVLIRIVAMLWRGIRLPCCSNEADGALRHCLTSLGHILTFILCRVSFSSNVPARAHRSIPIIYSVSRNCDHTKICFPC